jgi:hypothetical protein
MRTKFFDRHKKKKKKKDKAWNTESELGRGREEIKITKLWKEKERSLFSP